MCKRRVEGILRLFLIILVMAFFFLFLLPSSPPPRSERMEFFMRSKLRKTTEENLKNDEKINEEFNVEIKRENPESVKNLKAQIEEIKKNLKVKLNNEILRPEEIEQTQNDARKKIDELLQKIREKNL